MRVGLISLVVAVGAALIVACSSDGSDSSSTSKPTNQEKTAQGDSGASDSGSTAQGDSGAEFAPPDPPCETINYSDWSVCHYTSMAQRSVVSTAPPGCYTTGLVLRQPCEFTVPTDGPSLYEAYCAECHGTARKGTSAATARNAINRNVGGMNVLSSLTDAQLELIAAAK